MSEALSRYSEPEPSHSEKWVGEERRLKKILENLLLLFEIVYEANAAQEIVDWQRELRQSLPYSPQQLQGCLAYSICMFGTTDPETSPVIDFLGEFNIEALMRKKIQALEGKLNFDIRRLVAVKF